MSETTDSAEKAAENEHEERQSAIVQMEFDRSRIRRDDYKVMGLKMYELVTHIAQSCVMDTLKNGGTFVLMVSDETITLVQRENGDE